MASDDLDVMVWVDPDGDQIVLHDPQSDYEDGASGWIVVQSRQGFGRPPVEHTADTVPGQPGAIPRAARVTPRDLDMRIYLEARTVPELRTRLRDFTGRFDPARDGHLQVASGDGSVREIICRYVGGLDLTEDGESGGRVWQQFVLTLRAFDPYWADVDPIRLQFAAPPSTSSFFPLPPLHLAASSVFGAVSIDNPGEVDAWPVWTIDGPATTVTLANTTTGRTLTVTFSLPAGDQLVIDTRPGQKTVRQLSTGGTTNRYPQLASGARDLWPLQPGVNSCSVTVGGATYTSKVAVEITPRYLMV